MFAFFYLLIAFAIMLGSEEAGLFARSAPPAWWVVGGTLAVIVGVWTIGLVQVRLLLRAIVRGFWFRASLLAALYATLQLAAYWLILDKFYWGAWLASIEVFTDVSAVDLPVVGELLLLAPALILAAVALQARYLLDSVLRPGTWTRGSHFAFHFRWMMAPLPLLLLMQLVRDGMALVRHEVPAVQQIRFVIPSLDLIFEFVPLVIALLLFPYFLRLVFDTSSLPAGPLRERLETAARRLGVKYRDLLVWHTGRARVPNALVTGLFGRARYIFISDAMLNHFPEDELEAVFCHELGHVKHHHLLLYFAVLIGLVLAIDSLLAPLSLSLALALDLTWADLETVQATVLPVLMLGVMIFMMTVVSRMNERQADLAGSRFARQPLAIAAALERINRMMGGNMRDRPSPTHGSIASRVDFIEAAVRDPEIAQRFDRHAGFWHGTLRIAAFAAMLSLVLPLSEQIANAGVRARVFGILAPLLDRSEMQDAYTWREVKTAKEEMEKLAAERPGDATIDFFRGALAEELAGFVVDSEPERRADLLAESFARYRAARDASGTFDAFRPAAMRAVERLQESGVDPAATAPVPSGMRDPATEFCGGVRQ